MADGDDRYLFVCPWISVEKIILTQFFYILFFFRFFRKNSEIQDGCRGHMTTPSTKNSKSFFHLAMSVINAMQVKKV
jgi:hypothetical protein